MNTYGSHVVPSDQLAAFRPFLDAFSVPEATLIADVIQHFSERGISFSAAHVYDDVKASIGHLHNTGVLHDAIRCAITCRPRAVATSGGATTIATASPARP